MTGVFRLAASLTCIVIISLFQTCATEYNQDKFTIGKKGNIKAIVIPENAGPVIKFAATELQSYFIDITDEKIQIRESSTDNGNHVIQFIHEKDTSLKWDGYKIEITNGVIRLSAKEPRALLFAAYTLLEEAGCSFFYPGKNEEIIPRKALIEIQPTSRIYNPILEHRGLAPYGLDASSVKEGRNFIDWMAKNRMNLILVSEDRPSDSDGPANGSVWKEVNTELLPELQKRGFIIEMSEHCTPVFFPRSLFQEHPTWFALNKGQRKLGPPPYSGQMCYSNKDAIEYYASAIAKYAKEHPEFHIIGTWPLDGGDYCECKDCEDPQTVFKAAMRVAEKVGEVRPDMIVEHLAYKVQTWQPPAMKEIPRNMSVLWTSDVGVREELVKEWIKKSNRAGGVYQFEYFMGDNYRTRTNVWLRPEYSAGVAAQAATTGFRGVISLFLPIQNWWRSSFNNWFFARSCWEKNLNVLAYIKEYCQDHYGDQSGEAEEIFTLILTKLQREPYLLPEEFGAERLENTREVSKVLLEKLDKVSGKTKDRQIALRFERIKSFVEFSLLHCEAFASKAKPDLGRLIEYSRDHSDQHMVLMYPGYIQWRNEEYFP
jgi:hypothetical protein